MKIGKIPFEDERISKDQWKDVRDKMPFKALPVLTVDGTPMAQSQAMERYLGKLGGLYPSDPFTAFKVDEVMDTVLDVWWKLYENMGDDKEKFRKSRENFVKVEMPKLIGGLEKKLELYGKGPWAVGDKVGNADVSITTLVTTIRCGILDHVPKDLLDGYRRVMAVFEAVNSLPEIVEWYKEHPVKHFD